MATFKDSGHYAIAGFLYQFIGSGVAAFEVYEGLQSDDEPTEVLLVERLGQDAVVRPVDGSDKKPRLIQFKYSSKDETIAPSEIREILQTFLKSVRSQGMEIDQAAFELVTNRPYSRDCEKWIAAKTGSGSNLDNLIRRSSESDVADISDLASIFRNLDYKQASHDALRAEIQKTGAKFGMLDEEIKAGVDRLVGLLMRKAGVSGTRIVSRKEVHKAFVGHDNPYQLLSEDSVRLRRHDTARYKHLETEGQATIRRSVSDEIARAVFEYPVIVVVGDGGCGKSVAVSDAVAICLHDKDHPPGFGLIVPALEADPQATMGAVAHWRNLVEHTDGQDYPRSIDRLRRACADNPLLVICIDAIDEKAGAPRLPDRVQRFVREQMDCAMRDHQIYGIPVTVVVLTCRRVDELENLTRGPELDMPYHRINVTAFDDDELTQLIVELDGSVRSRIAGHLQLPGWQISQFPSRSERPISPDSMKTIRQPIIWRFFSKLDVQAQHACLDDVRGLDLLGPRYLDWFRRKAEIRIRSLQNRECSEALLAVCFGVKDNPACHGFKDNPARVAERETDWLIPCTAAGCARLNAGLLLGEAITAGILIEDESGGRRWRWKQKWFCEYLLRAGMNRHE
jgi:hypothetical protein